MKKVVSTVCFILLLLLPVLGLAAVKKQALAISRYHKQLEKDYTPIPQPDANNGVIWYESFESASTINSGYDDDTDLSVAGDGTVDPNSTTVSHTNYGSEVLKVVTTTATSATSLVKNFGATAWDDDFCLRFYVYFTATPAANTIICQGRIADSTVVIRLRYLANGNVSMDLNDNSSTMRTYSISSPGNAKWHLMEFRFKTGSSNCYAKFVKDVHGTPTTYENNFAYTPYSGNVNNFRFGCVTATTAATYYFDDITIRNGAGLTYTQSYLGDWTCHGLLTDASDDTKWLFPCESYADAQFDLAAAADTSGNVPLAVRSWMRSKQSSTTTREIWSGFFSDDLGTINLADRASKFMAGTAYQDVFHQNEYYTFVDPKAYFTWTTINKLTLELSTGTNNQFDHMGAYVSKAWFDVIYGDDNTSGDIDSFLTHGPVFSAGADEGATSSVKVWGRASGATSLVVRYGTSEADVKAGYGTDTAISSTQAVTTATYFGTPNSGIKLTGLTPATTYYIDVLVKQYNAGTPGTPDELRFTYDNEQGGNVLSVGDACTWGSTGSGHVIYKAGSEMIVSCGRTSEVYEQVSDDTWIKKSASNSCQASANSTHWISTYLFENDFSTNYWNPLPSFNSHLADGYEGQFNVSPSGDIHSSALDSTLYGHIYDEDLQQFIMMGDEINLENDDFETDDILYSVFLKRRNWDAWNMYYWKNVLSKTEYARCISDHEIAENNSSKAGNGTWTSDFSGLGYLPSWKPVQVMRDTTSYYDLAGADDYTGTADAFGTVKDSETATAIGTKGVGSESSHKWFATRFQAGSSYSLKSVAYYMAKSATGTCDFNIRAHIYSDDSGSPGSSLGSSCWITGDDVETTAGWLAFGFRTAIPLTSGIYYWAVVEASETDLSQYILWSYSATNSSISYDANGEGTWSLDMTSEKLLFRTYAENVSITLVDAASAERQIKYSSISGGTPVARNTYTDWDHAGGDSVEWGSSWEYSGTLLFHDETDKVMIILCDNSADPLTTSQNIRKAGGIDWITSGTHDYVYNFPTVSRYGIYPGMMVGNVLGENSFGIGIVKKNYGTYVEAYYSLSGGKYLAEGDSYIFKRSGLFYKFTQGNAKFVVMDIRSRRDPNLTPNGDKFDGTSYPSSTSVASECFSKDLTGAYDFNDYLTAQTGTTSVLIKHSQTDLTDKIVKWDMVAAWDSTDATFRGFALIKNATNANGGYGDIELEWEIPGTVATDRLRFFESGASNHGWNLETNAEKDKANINAGHIQRTFVEQDLRDNAAGYWSIIITETPFHSEEIVGDDKWGDYDTTSIMHQVTSGSWVTDGSYKYYTTDWYEKPEQVSLGGMNYEVDAIESIDTDEEWWWDTADYVLGTDSKTYTCIKNHTSSSDDTPITGGNWATYWKERGSDGGAWADSTAYDTGRVYVYGTKTTTGTAKFYYSAIETDGVTPHENSVPFYDRCASRRYLKDNFGDLNKIVCGADRHFASLHKDKTDADPWPYVLCGILSCYNNAKSTRKTRVDGKIVHYHENMGAWIDQAGNAERYGGYALLEINEGGSPIIKASIKERDGELVNLWEAKAGDPVLGILDDFYWLHYMTMTINFESRVIEETFDDDTDYDTPWDTVTD